ncbi:hypothetical protein B0H11DRAFT_2090162 [Mycena galericulata]|nr:hypothetical protein B0H11DRAFT_2090162 [Mycena galericulata]
MRPLPDEIISEILCPALRVPEELFADSSDVSPFAKYTPSTSVYLLVCKDWLRVATPLLYNVVVLRSKAQANALERVLKTNPHFGAFIKKLRIEGGYGKAMHTILKTAPNITDLFLSLLVWSSDNTQGLCKGLPLINPHRVIVVDPRTHKPVPNKNRTALADILFSCFKKWDNLRVFGFPNYKYRVSDCDPRWTARGLALATALTESQTLHTVVMTEVVLNIAYIPVLCEIPSLRILHFKEPLTRRRYEPLAARIDSELKKFARFTIVEDTTLFEIAPSLNPNFKPMESASDETRDLVWKRVLFFAMRVEDFRSPKCFGRGSTSNPSRIRLLTVSKSFHRIGLPYLYDCLVLSHKTAPVVAARLLQQPSLGTFIRYVFFTGNIFQRVQCVAESDICTIFSYAKNIEYFPLDSGFGLAVLSAQAFELLARNAGHSLRELSCRMRSLDLAVASTLTELRVLRLKIDSSTVNPGSLSVTNFAKVHTLHLCCDRFFWNALSRMRLDSLHTVHLHSPDDPDAFEALTIHPGALNFLTIHGPRILHLKLHSSSRTGGFKPLDMCSNLVDIEFPWKLDPDLLIHTTSCKSSLVKVIARFIPKSTTSEALDDLAQNFKSFPSLQEIHFRGDEWPTTEREIAKCPMVRLAEALFEDDIKISDSSGMYWVPRVKCTRTRKKISGPGTSVEEL